MILCVLNEGALPVDTAECDYAVEAETTGNHVYQVLHYTQENRETKAAVGERAKFGPAIEGSRSKDREDEPT